MPKNACSRRRPSLGELFAAPCVTAAPAVLGAAIALGAGWGWWGLAVLLALLIRAVSGGERAVR